MSLIDDILDDIYIYIYIYIHTTDYNCFSSRRTGRMGPLIVVKIMIAVVNISMFYNCYYDLLLIVAQNHNIPINS